jgi:hypothetical protein
MLDWYIVLAPILMLVVVMLLGFVGCYYRPDVHVTGNGVNCGGPQVDERFPDEGEGGTPDDDTLFSSVGGSPFKAAPADMVLDHLGNPVSPVYGTARVGPDFRYVFTSLKEGVLLRLTLSFAEIGTPSSPGERVFQFTVDGGTGGSTSSSGPYDIVLRAGGRLRARDEDIGVTVGSGRTLTISLQGLAGIEPRAMINAIQFNLATVPPGPSAIFVGTDALTQGNWIGVRGSDGFALADVPPQTFAPIYIPQLNVSALNVFTYENPTNDPRGLQNSAGTAKFAATWFDVNQLTLDVPFADALPRQVAIYCLDFDSLGRTQTIEMLDLDTLAVLDTQNLSNFQGGIYLIWSLIGRIRLRITNTNPGNNRTASFGGIFFG